MTEQEYNFLHLVRRDCPLPPGTPVDMYLRDSGGEEQDNSVAQQLAAGREYCQFHGLLLNRVYLDASRQSSNIEKREELQALLSNLRERFPHIDDLYKRDRAVRERPYGIIFWRSNRLGRDQRQTDYIKADIALRGITIIDLVTTANTGNAGVDMVLDSFQRWRDAEALNDISKDAKRGLAALVTKRDNDPEFLHYNPGWQVTGNYLGIHPGSVPAGFKAERITVGTYKRKNGKRSGELRVVQRIVPDPETWPRARLAWEMRRDNATLEEIKNATNLYDTLPSYASFFQNLIYTGTFEYGGQRIENFVPALIPMQWWEDEQATRAKRAKRRHGLPLEDATLDPRRVGAKHLLSGILYCGENEGEEHAMLAGFIPAKEGVRGHWDFYICSRKKNSHSHECAAPRIGARNLEKQVVANLMSELLRFDLMRVWVDQISVDLDATLARLKVELDAAISHCRTKERQIANLIQAIEDTGMTPSLKEKLTAREGELAELRAKVQQLESDTADHAQAPEITDEMLHDWIDATRKRLNEGDPDLARRTVRQFVEKVVIRHGEGQVHYRVMLPKLTITDGLYLDYGKVDPRGFEPLTSTVRL